MNTTAGSVGVTGSVAVAEPVTVDGTVAVSAVAGTVTTALANTHPRRAATMNGEPVAAQSATILVAPVPGTLTTGANRGNPAYGDTFCVTVQKTAGGSAIADAALLVRSVY